MQCVTHNMRHIIVHLCIINSICVNVFCLPKGGMHYVTYNTRHYGVLFMYWKFHLCKYLFQVSCGTIIGVDHNHGTCHDCAVINM